jgi:hypothetical protein
VEFLYFPLNGARLPHLHPNEWDPLDDKLLITAATRVALPTDGSSYATYNDNQLSKPNFAYNVAAYLGWLFFEIADQTQNLDLQVRINNQDMCCKAEVFVSP